MTTYSLTPYTIRILAPGGIPQQVDKFLGSNDLFAVLEDYLLGLKAKLYRDTTARFILRVHTLNKDEKKRFLFGRMDRGDYGIQSELFNTTTMKPAYTRKPEDAELLPYHFFLGIPRQPKGLGGRAPLHAIAVFQTMDGLGIQDAFDDNFSYHFGKLFAPLHVDIERLIPKKFVKQLLKRGRVTQLRFIQYQVPTSIEEMAKHGPTLDEGILEFRLKAKRGMAFDMKDRLNQVLNGEREIKDFIGVKGFHYDDVKIQLESNGKYHTLNLGRLESTRAPYEYDITGRIAAALNQGDGRQSAADLIDQLAREYCESLATELDLTF